MNADIIRPGLYLCPTPIGNLRDITLRAIDVLGRADCILAEDTRRTRILLNHYQIEAPSLESYHKYNEVSRHGEVLDRLRRGEVVALVSDAGSPGISDPGERLVALCVREGIHVTALPGPTAFVPAVTVSGLSTAEIHFHGFLPRRASEREAWLKAHRAETGVHVLYESARRLRTFIRDITMAWGDDRRMAVVREISKMFEEVVRGTGADVLS